MHPRWTHPGRTDLVEAIFVMLLRAVSSGNFSSNPGLWRLHFVSCSLESQTNVHVSDSERKQKTQTTLQIKLSCSRFIPVEGSFSLPLLLAQRGAWILSNHLYSWIYFFSNTLISSRLVFIPAASVSSLCSYLLLLFLTPSNNSAGGSRCVSSLRCCCLLQTVAISLR